MEFGVLELGLKNKQIVNISCFLRIQVEAFRVDWLQKCETHSYSVLFNQWIQVFHKIVTIMSATLKETVSDADKYFGSKLAKITLQTCFKLLSFLTNEPMNSDLREQRMIFLTELHSVIDKIRVIAKGDKAPICEMKEKLSIDNYSKEWHSLSSDDVILDAVHHNKLPLAISYLKFTRSVNIDWKSVVQIIFADISSNLTSQNFSELTSLLSQINIPIKETVNELFLSTADSDLRSFLYSKLEIPQKMLLREKQWWEQLNLIENVYKDCEIRLNINCVKRLEAAQLQNLLISPLRENEDYEFDEKTLKYLSPKVVWQCLVTNRDIELIRKWISSIGESTSKTKFPFNWSTTTEMLNFVQNTCAHDYLKENILSYAATKGLFCEEELKFTNLTVRRLLRCNFLMNSATLLDSDSHPLKLMKSYNFSDFQQKLVDYALNNNMFYFLYWFTNIGDNKRYLESSKLNSSVKNVLQSCIAYKENPDDEWALFNYILVTAQHVYNLPSPVNLQSLLDSGLSQLAVLALQYCPTGFVGAIEANSDHIVYVNRNSLASSLKTNYPLLYQAFINVAHSEESNKFYTQDSVTVYSLLKDTIIFDISKLFCWQTTNSFRNIENSAFVEMPSFSDPKLAAKYGFKAKLTAIYYLNRGRPVEAYFKWLKEKGMGTKQLNIGCKKASLLAFYNCTEKSVTSACVVFVELLSGNSSNLRLHLCVAQLIMSHSANFLGFEPRNQLQELGNLLKKACYHDDKRAATKLYQLMVAAFDRKYGADNDSLLNECFEYKIAINFCKHYKLEPPIDFLVKCAKLDDWLLFTLFAQLYDIPNTTVLKILTGNGSDSFNNKCIAEHLEKAFQPHYLQHARPKEVTETKNILKGSSANRYRNILLQRIGVKKEKTKFKPVQVKSNSFDDDNSSTISDSDVTAVETTSVVSSSIYSEYFDGITFDFNNPPKDLFSLILTCQKCNPVEPWKPLLSSSVILRNPIPALIAASIQDSDTNLFDCFCCWLFASFDFPAKNTFNRGEPCISWANQNFLTLVKSALIIPENYRIFHIGLQIFSLTSNPLTDLICFFIQFLEEKEFHASVKLLKTFQEKLWNYECIDDSSFPLNSKRLIEETGVVLLSCALKATNCGYQLHILLRYLDFSRLQSSFSNEIPDFHKMYRLSQCLENTSLLLNVSLFIDVGQETEEFKSSVMKIIYSLQELEYFSEAIQFASICDLSCESLFLNEWTVKAMKKKEEFGFWKEAFHNLESSQISHKLIYNFAQEFADKIDSLLSRCFLLAKLLEYFMKTTENQNEISLSEKILWELCVRVQMEKNTLPNFDTVWSEVFTLIKNIAKSVKIDLKYSINNEFQGKCELQEDEVRSLDVFLSNLLNCGCIEFGFRIANIFYYQSRDLELIYACHYIASGKSASDLRNSSMLFFSNPSILQDFSCLEIKEILERMCLLSTFVGDTACQRILLYYKISIILGLPYMNIFKERDEIGLVKNLISCNSSNETLALTKELVSLIGISDECVAEFVSSDIFQSIKSESEKFDEVSVSECETTNFLSVMRLLSNPSVLGKKLLEYVENGSIDDHPAAVSVEVFVKAHDCFTLSSDVEGISNVLRKVKNMVTQRLLEKNDFHSMIRLLKGIGRYSEMTYIFDILKENDAFELLLGKGIEKVPQLRVALLDSVKSDKETFTMIALNFSMHREIAEMMESSAMKTIKSLQLRRQQSQMSFKTILERVLEEMIDASESYTKAGCYTKADLCAKRAELIALQINYLPSGLVILNLTETAVADFVSKHHKFPEALIVADAYQHQRSWDQALFNLVVLHGDWNYFRDYSLQIKLTTTNFEEIIALYTKYKNSNFLTLSSDKQTSVNYNLQKLLTHLPDLRQQYQYCMLLDFHEMANNLLHGENGAFLRDLKRLQQI